MFTKFLGRFGAKKRRERSTDEIRAEVLADHDKIGDAQARRFVRGNVNIKQGAYIFKLRHKTQS